MRAIANGRTDNAYLIAESGVMSAVMALHYFLGGTPEARAAAREFMAAVADFYKQHPDRRASLAAHLTQTPDVLGWTDAKQ